MALRQTTGSVLCRSCRQLVGVNDARCFHCGAAQPGLWGFAPLVAGLGRDLGFVTLVVWGCSALYLASLAMDPGRIGMQGLGLLAPSGHAVFVLGASGSVPVFDAGRWWTLLSAGWLHGSALHILFNMLWVRDLGPVTAQLYGPSRAAIIFFGASVTGFVASSSVGQFLPFLPGPLGGGHLTLGASAAIFGLLGAMIYYGRRAGSQALGDHALRYAIILGVMGFVLPGVDNWAHGGGFAGGYLLARWLDPLIPERPHHFLLALALVVGSALSILGSVVHGLRLLGQG